MFWSSMTGPWPRCRNASAAKFGKSARIATKLAPPFSLPNYRSRAGTNRSEIPPSPTASSTVWSTTPIASRCAASPCEKTATHPRIKASNDPHLLYKEAGAKGLLPLSPAPQIPAEPNLRFAPDDTILLDDSEHLLHNHHASVASLRLLFTFAPERRSASLRNRCSPSPEYPELLPNPQALLSRCLNVPCKSISPLTVTSICRV